MKRRARTGGKKSKERRRKTPTAKRRAAPAAARPRRSSDVDLQQQLDHSRRELREAREQQIATSEVLQVISSSPGDLQAVFEVMLENATRICEARSGNLLRYEDGAFAVVALHNAPPAFVDDRRRNPLIRPTAGQPLGRLVSTKQTVHVADLKAEPSYIGGTVSTVGLVELAGARTLLSVPLLKDNEVIGAFNIYRQDVRPFTDKQIELVQNFAAQAVIAIENTRLLNELRQRTDDLTESLEQQTATSEVLKVISSSPGDLSPVFDALLSNALHICEAKFGNLLLVEGDAVRMAANKNAPQAYLAMYAKGPLRPGPDTAVGRVIRTKAITQINDIVADAKAQHDPLRIATAEILKARTLLAVPMLKDDELIGVLVIYRQEVRPFTENQIELLQNFAAQAVIAIENTRLLNELRQRNAHRWPSSLSSLSSGTRSRFERRRYPPLSHKTDRAPDNLARHAHPVSARSSSREPEERHKGSHRVGAAVQGGRIQRPLTHRKLTQSGAPLPQTTQGRRMTPHRCESHLPTWI